VKRGYKRWPGEIGDLVKRGVVGVGVHDLARVVAAALARWALEAENVEWR